MRKLRYNLIKSYWEEKDDNEPVHESYPFKKLEDALKKVKEFKDEDGAVYEIREESLTDNIMYNWDSTGKFWDDIEIEKLLKLKK